MALDDAVAAPAADRTVALVVAIPLALLAAGFAIRYAAFLWISERSGALAYAEALCRWDCAWYVGIAEGGYNGFPTGGQNVGNWGFFPLYPLLLSGFTWLVPLPIRLAGVLLSTGLSFAACLAAWPLLGRRLRPYTLYCAFILAGPFSMYFTGLLTESLFVLLGTLVFLALRHSRYLAAGGAAALLSATRIVGVFVVFALVAKLVQDFRSSGEPLAALPRRLIGRPDLLLAIFVSPLGLFAYMLHLHLLVGDALAFSHVQRAFGRNIVDPLTFLLDALTTMPASGFWPTGPQWSALAALTGLGLAAAAIRRGWPGAGLFGAICILLPLSSGLASMVRYVAGLAPLWITAALLLSERRWTAAAALAACPVMCWINTIDWMRGSLVLV